MNPHYIYKLILHERQRQELLHPYKEKKSDYEMNAVLVEEVGEVSRALQEDPTSNLEEELIQVAAVVFRWLEMKER
jgi:NTP pyrophosphatase (non-canonical NTP hydrolase)